MMKRFINILAIILIIAIIPLAGQGEYSTGEGTAGTESVFKLGFGARSLGMGRAFTGLADDNSAIFFNPAGLYLIEKQNVSVFYTNLLMDVNYSFISYVLPTMHFGTFGIAVGGWHAGEIDYTEEDIAVSLGQFAFDNYRAYISYGYDVWKGIQVGTSFKMIYQNESALNRTSFGFGADLGLMYIYKDAPVIGTFRSGLNVINALEPQLKLGEEVDPLPMTFRFGLSKPLAFGENDINIALDLTKPNTAGTDFQINFGAEYIYNNIASLRVGFDQINPSFGAGVQWNGISIDYSYHSLTADGNLSSIEMPHQFSLSYSWGEKRTDLLEIERLSALERDSVMVDRALSAEHQKQIERHMNAGMEFMDKEEWFNATVEFQQVIAIDPFNQEARNLFKEADRRLQEEYERERMEYAAAQRDTALARQNQEFIDFHYNKGRGYLEKNQFNEALFEFNTALERDSENQVLLDARNSAQRRLNEEITQLIEDGRRQFRLGNYSEALKLLSHARVLVADDNTILSEIELMSRRIQVQGDLNKGLQALDAGDYELAAEIFKQALATDPTNVDIQKYLRRADSKANARKIVLDPADEKEYLNGVDEFLNGNYQDALNRWDVLLEKYPYSKKLIDAVETAEQRLKRTQSSVLER